MSMLWDGDNPELKRFYQREQRLTKSQTVARRMLVALVVSLIFIVLWAIWGVK